MFLCCKLIIKIKHSTQGILIQTVFPDLVAAEYKTLADKRLCLNNKHQKLIRFVIGDINRTLRSYWFR